MLENFTRAILLVTLCLYFYPATGQNHESEHQFKIVGNVCVPVSDLRIAERLVEPDPKSPDHLYIIDFGYSGPKRSITRFLFLGKKFNLQYLTRYKRDSLLLKDGEQFIYGQNEFILARLQYNKNELINQTFFDEHGNKTTMLSGNGTILDGEFKTWYNNGQLQFSGNYKNDQKHGRFESFDREGHLQRSGTYAHGQLVDGLSVVQDLEYTEPEKYSQFSISGRNALSDYLQQASHDLPEVEQLQSNEFHILPVKLHIDQRGEISKLNLNDIEDENMRLLVKKAFAKIPGFIPAEVENAPVRSTLSLVLHLDRNGLKDANLVNLPRSGSNAYSIVEKMPKFPGGQEGIRKFLAKNIMYPQKAVENRLNGKVFVRFIIKKNGKISEPEVIKGVDPLLDKEALRVISLMPELTPGYHDGKAVPVVLTTPISFIAM